MTEFKRHLGLTSAAMVVVGSVIGSGVFMKPLQIAESLGSPALILVLWGALGLVCLFGALAYGELGTMFPDAGGQYTYLREGYGRFVAFLYGWCLFFVINTGTLAALAVAFATNLANLIPLNEFLKVFAAVAMVLVLAWTNHRGVAWGARLQNVSTFAKLLALAALVAGGLFASGVAFDPANAKRTVEDPGVTTAGIAMACIAMFWTYEGWYQLPFNAAELKRPERHLPGGLILGVLVLVVTYVGVNAIYLHVVPLEEMRVQDDAADVPYLAMERIFGAGSGAWLSALVCLSVFGAANPNLLSSPRAFYMMSKDGLAARALMRIHPRHQTPSVAIWVQTVWALVLIVVLETFDDITSYVVFASLIFYGLTVAAVYVLRRTRPDHPRPFRCWGYPVTPLVFLAVVVFVDVQALTIPSERRNALYGLAILAVGALVYVFLVPRPRRT